MDSIAATSLIGYRSLCGGFPIKDGSCKRKSLSNCRVLGSKFTGKNIISLSYRLLRLRVDRLVNTSIKARAIELTRETYLFREEEERILRSWGYQANTGVDRKPSLWPPENRADNLSLQNPLLR